MEDGSLLCSGAWSVVSLLPIVMALGRGRIQSLSTRPQPGQEAQVLLDKDLLRYAQDLWLQDDCQTW